MVMIPLANLLVPPLWGFAADALHARLQLLRLTSVGCGLAVLLLWPDRGFVGALVAVAIFAFFRAPIISLADAATYALLDRARPHFSAVRVWGSVGFALFALVLGRLEASTWPALLLLVTAGAYLLAAASTLPMRAPHLKREHGVLREVSIFLRKPALLLFLAGTVTHYLGQATYDAYFALWLRQLGHGDAVVGYAWAVGVGVEIVVMLLAPRFLHRLPSSWWLTLGALAAAARWLLTSQTESSTWLVMIQGLHGLGFGLWYLAMVRYVQTQAPERLRTSLQSIANAAMGLGMVGGYLVGGRLFSQWGGHGLYLAAAGAGVVAAVCYTAARLAERPGRGG